MKRIDIFNSSPLFITARLVIKPWQVLEKKALSKQILLEEVNNILSPNVIKDLPDSWQNLNSLEEIEEWVNDRNQEGYFYGIEYLESNELVGLLFLYAENTTLIDDTIALRLGYLLKESKWGKGLASEMIAALILWSKDQMSIRSISAGVEVGNIGSIKVLEKNGFVKSNHEMPIGVLLYELR
ncbi:MULTISPECIES: GNAT family N-acetyltransferase [unclassified Lentimicrobium]|uniref:GNAT family N-acetyltransferase n=1 Tax=unclassified Lentimicrobium TaxID=2677434 RepID=UPI001551E320|nr:MULTISPECIES: GNAT family N-acetyltransferase [unclassified Lentimicrobium]NPD46119.1 GNAT family N-acetyltransferase [Lentimicrobium sp. S6]NPD86469.1 GNAT family N-acetyltransferase [Lentimicrobium sp. L6]